MNSMERVLKIYQALRNGEKITADRLSSEFGRHRETAKRDITTIRNVLAEEGLDLVYNRREKLYEVKQRENQMNTAQVYTILSVLHGSRTFNRDEMKRMEEQLALLLPKDAQTQLNQLIQSYRFHYRASTNEPMLKWIATILDSILNQCVLDITYVTARFEERHMRIAPYTVIFDEGYFYCVVKILPETEHENAESEPPLFNLRIDRIKTCHISEEKFTVNLSGDDYFKAGEYAQLSAKMFSGEKRKKIKIRVQSHVVSYFEDKFPLYSLIEKAKQWSTYEFSVLNEEGALFWILSERDWVEVIEPKEMRDKIKKIIANMAKRYDKA